MWFYLLLMALIVIADRIVKFWALTSLAPVSEAAGISGLFHFHYIENTGAAFSFLSEHTWILTVISVIVVAAALYCLIAKKFPRCYDVFIAFIAAGGFANLFDRVVYGYVVDMFEIDFMRFAVFNVADIGVTCGIFVFIIALLVDMFFTGKRGSHSSAKQG